jgi:hypothetical protein
MATPFFAGIAVSESATAAFRPPPLHGGAST